MDYPPISSQTASSLVQTGQNRAYQVSGGRLSDFSPGSPVTAILEANAAIASQLIAVCNNIAATIENNRLAVFQLDKIQAVPAVGTILVTLDGLYNTPFLLARGFPLTLNGIPFQTVADLTIPAYQATGAIGIAATQGGIAGNLPIGAIVSYQTVPKLANITLTAATAGGLDAETDDQWKKRIYGLLRRRDTLISIDDFQAAVVNYLGQGSVGVAIARLKPDKLNYANGYVGVFGLNPDGSQLNTAQLANLGSFLNQKAPMATITLWSLDVFTLNISTVAGFLPGVDPATLAATINTQVKAYLAPGNLPAGAMILNKAIEFIVQQQAGVALGIVTVKINGYAQPQALPTAWTVGTMGTHTIALTQNNQTFTYNF